MNEINGVHLTSKFKTQLAEHIRTVVADPRARVWVGARRRPEAVLMSVAADVPASIRRILLRAWVMAEAENACPNGRFIGVDDTGGTILGWLWDHDHAEAMTYLGRLVDQILARVDNITPAAILNSLPEALPADMPRAELNRLIEHAKRHIAASGNQGEKAGP